MERLFREPQLSAGVFYYPAIQKSQSRYRKRNRDDGGSRGGNLARGYPMHGLRVVKPISPVFCA